MSFLDRTLVSALAAVDNALARAYGRTADVAVPGPWQDRESDLLPTVTPEALATIIRRRNDGELRQWADLCDHARRSHPHLHSQLQVRELSVQETEFEVVAGAKTAKALKAAAACEELYAHWQELGWCTWASDIVGVKLYPAGLQEVTWRRWEGLMAPVELTRIAERRLSYACDRFDPDPWSLRVWDQGDALSPFGGFYGVKVSDLHPDKFLVHEPRVVGGHRASEGLFAVLCWYWLFGVYSWKHLMALLEAFGRPPVIGYYNAGGAKADGALGKSNGERKATREEVDAGKLALSAMSGSLRAMLPDTVRLEALKFEIPANPAQILTSDRVDAYMSKAINGTTGVTDIVAGARSAHETAAKQAMTPYRADCRDVARVGTELFRRFVRANPDYFGANCPLPRMVASDEDAVDLVQFTAAMKAAKETGARIPELWFMEQIGAPIAKANERVLGDPMPGEEPTKEPLVAVTDPAAVGAKPPAGPTNSADSAPPKEPVA